MEVALEEPVVPVGLVAEGVVRGAWAEVMVGVETVVVETVEALAVEHGLPLEVERVSLNGHEKGVVAYFGFVEEEAEDVREERWHERP